MGEVASRAVREVEETQKRYLIVYILPTKFIKPRLFSPFSPVKAAFGNSPVGLRPPGGGPGPEGSHCSDEECSHRKVQVPKRQAPSLPPGSSLALTLTEATPTRWLLDTGVPGTQMHWKCCGRAKGGASDAVLALRAS